MAEETGSKVGYFLLGLVVGSLIAILSAPKSGEETRKYLSQNVKERNEYAQKKAPELSARAEDLSRTRYGSRDAEERTNCRGSGRGPRGLPKGEIEGERRLNG